MKATFYGAVREVTGSSHLLSIGKTRILLDCGLFQGNRKRSAEKNKSFLFDPAQVTNLLLSHAHIDHSGRIPLLCNNGFKGRIITTRPTHDACEFMLRDSGHIQESDADYLNYKAARAFVLKQEARRKKNKRLTNAEIRNVKKVLKRDNWYLNKSKILEVVRQNNLPQVTPLYTQKDAEEALEQFEGYPYNTPVEIGDGVTCTFYDAGHILGSAITIIEAEENGKKTTVGYTGDLGRFEVPILRNPTLEFPPEHRKLDLLIMESTYGNRLHDPVSDLEKSVAEAINRTYDRGGSVVIPSFAMERTQTIIYMLHQLYNEGKLPSMPVYVDSPLASNLTKVFAEHPECYDYETHKTFLENGENPFSFRQLKYTQSVEESMALNKDLTPHIVLSASGMCESGRILHHLRNKIHDERNTILFVGYQAQNTLGRRIIELTRKYKENGGEYPEVNFMRKTYPIKAEVVQLEGFSGHADQSEMVRFLSTSNLDIKKIALVHGENESIDTLSGKLGELNYKTFIPKEGESVPIE
ncbi:MBL fold metallo-hydrolase RNA specificity domain-containing protein [Candidatus Latescibacterota bacterium]